MRYDVEAHAVVKVKLGSIEAADRRAAIDAARKRFADERIGDKLGLAVPDDAVRASFGNEIVRYVVDEHAMALRERTQSGELPEGNSAIEVTVPTIVDPDWLAMVSEWNDLFSTDHCGYYLRGILRDPALGWLAWEDDEQHEMGEEPDLDEAIVAWRAGYPLPQGYYRLDAEFARRSWAEGVKLAGEPWFVEGDSTRYDYVVQQTLFGKQVYG